MGVARSSYYYEAKRADQRERQDEELKQRIEAIHLSFPSYGYRRIQQSLARQGLNINHKRVRRIMDKYGLEARMPRRFIATTNSVHSLRRFPDLLSEVFAVTRLNEVWVADITYIRVERGFIYLAIILDLCSRKVVGWALSRKLDQSLSLAALTMALEERKPDPGCMHHSDQGVQYCCHAYVNLLEQNGFRVSMSPVANPYANAAAESFMKTLKYEEVYLYQYKDFEEVLRKVPRFIEDVYNKKRLHSSIGYLSPEEYEWMLTANYPVNPEN